MEFRPGYGPEVYTGLWRKSTAFLMGVIGNRQGFLPEGYPEYADYPGIGGKLYRQGLIKMNEFVTLCGRDRVPIVWFQDTIGIDVGDIAEKAELLGLGQSLIYSIEQTDVPMMLVVLQKGHGRGPLHHGRPHGQQPQRLHPGHPDDRDLRHARRDRGGGLLMPGGWSRKRMRASPSDPVIDKMNELAQQYYDKSRPVYCAKRGFVDEIVSFADIRKYIAAFVGCAYQNPKSICPHHHMMLPRIIRG